MVWYSTPYVHSARDALHILTLHALEKLILLMTRPGLRWGGRGARPYEETELELELEAEPELEFESKLDTELDLETEASQLGSRDTNESGYDMSMANNGLW